MTDCQDELSALMSRLRAGPLANQPERELSPPPPPMYILNVDTPDERSIVLIVEQTRDGDWMTTISLPKWHELEEGWDGPHEMPTAIRLANGYAEAYGYSSIAIDIPSSQLWQEEWGTLVKEGS